MKNLVKILASMSLLAIMAQFAFGQGITGTAHDFSAQAWNPTGEICIVCHTPHDADISITDAPLWNHESTAVGAYTLYGSPTFDGTATIGQPSGSSKMCLSCHDGTVALENFSGTVGGVNFIGAAYEVGGGADLSAEHPISFTYNTALATADGGLHDPEQRFNGVVGLLYEPVCIICGQLFMILENLKKQGILVLKMLVYGPFGNSHFLREGIHGHAPDTIFPKQGS